MTVDGSLSYYSIRNGQRTVAIKKDRRQMQLSENQCNVNSLKEVTQHPTESASYGSAPNYDHGTAESTRLNCLVVQAHRDVEKRCEGFV